MNKGKIVQVMGPVVDVEFSDITFHASKMHSKLIIMEKNVSWKWHSILEMIP